MPKRKRSVAGIAIEGGRIFIARRKAGGDLGGKWEFPGGKAEEGEAGPAALVREYQEEFGVAIETGPLLSESAFEHRGDTYSLSAYRVFFKCDDLKSRIRLAEHTEWRWASLGEIERLDFAASDRGLLPALQAYLDQQSGVQE